MSIHKQSFLLVIQPNSPFLPIHSEVEICKLPGNSLHSHFLPFMNVGDTLCFQPQICIVSKLSKMCKIYTPFGIYIQCGIKYIQYAKKQLSLIKIFKHNTVPSSIGSSIYNICYTTFSDKRCWVLPVTWTVKTSSRCLVQCISAFIISTLYNL